MLFVNSIYVTSKKFDLNSLVEIYQNEKFSIPYNSNKTPAAVEYQSSNYVYRELIKGSLVLP